MEDDIFVQRVILELGACASGAGSTPAVEVLERRSVDICDTNGAPVGFDGTPLHLNPGQLLRGHRFLLPRVVELTYGGDVTEPLNSFTTLRLLEGLEPLYRQLLSRAEMVSLRGALVLSAIQERDRLQPFRVRPFLQVNAGFFRCTYC